MCDVVLAVLEAAARWPAAPALTGPGGRTLTHGQLGARIRAVAGRLRAAGFEPGERMLFSVRPSPDAVVLALGVAAAGGTVVFVDPGAGPELFAARTELAAPGWAAAESVLYAAGRGPLRALARRRGVLLPDYAALPVRHVRAGRWLPGVPRGALDLATLQRPGPPVAITGDPAQDAVVVFTSGTTAAPRAVVHTRGSLGAALGVLASRCALGPGARVHTDQFLLGLPALVGGAHWSMPPFGFAPGSLARRSWRRGWPGPPTRSWCRPIWPPSSTPGSCHGDCGRCCSARRRCCRRCSRGPPRRGRTSSSSPSTG